MDLGFWIAIVSLCVLLASVVYTRQQAVAARKQVAEAQPPPRRVPR